MKKLKYEIIGNLYHSVFPDKLIKERKDLLIIVLESCRFMMQNTEVEQADNLMMLVVNDMNRLFFCKKKKMYSIMFPFHTKCYPTIHFDFEGIDINSSMISKLCTIIGSKEFDMPISLDFFSLIDTAEAEFPEDFWRVLKFLMTYELGCIRYDDDKEGFSKASCKGVPKRHPRYHYDVNYSQKAAFKIGLSRDLTPDKFVDFLDDTKDRKVLRE